ncbi:hypothetical protein BMS3Bbin04_01772 [bacterium BMS3Bbin04]|nr:hypothetical protein BMS3Bbin04_01772 [bacterium BMS3Bbin04]
MKRIAWFAIAVLMMMSFVQTADALVYEFGGGTGFENRGGDIWAGEDNDSGQDGIYQYDFRPHFAVFLNHNTTLGAYFNLSIEDYSAYNLTEIELGPRIGYYFTQMGPGYPFVETRVSYGALLYSNHRFGSFTESHIATEIGGGYLYLLNQNVGVTGGLYYEQHFYDQFETGWISGNKFGVQLGIRAFIY